LGVPDAAPSTRHRPAGNCQAATCPRERSTARHRESVGASRDAPSPWRSAQPVSQQRHESFLPRIEVLPGTRGGYGEGIIHADYTHSLVGALLISVAFGGVSAFWWRREVAVILAGVVFSHWLLDLPMHRADMPLLPGNAGHGPLLGFGLWRAPFLAMLLELAIVVAGAALYRAAAIRTAGTSASAAARRAGLYVLLAGALTLGLSFFGL
jgi:hypothetical protein